METRALGVHIVAELAANAATHGRAPGRDFHLSLTATKSVLRVEVAETRGDRLPRAQPAAPQGESGRGLVLVEALSDRWGVTTGPPPRKTVWAEPILRRDGALTGTRPATSR
ncbi:ATP-binding protein [Streptomyces sp. R41]|uniref:ATP-binding protein n=1 Tax=Streptomyces sp. R41 TaxID=3238632 RepID=A0AB39RJN6_9ACTN